MVKGVLIGVVVALLSFFVKEYYQDYRRKRIELKRYCICLESTRNELLFYLETFNKLLSDISSIFGAVRTPHKIIIPTYSLYPNFLEHSKIKLNSFFRNSELVRTVGHCHFELSHILLGLDLMKYQLQSYISNPKLFSASDIEYDLKGFQKLVTNNIEMFKKAISDIEQELSKVRSPKTLIPPI